MALLWSTLAQGGARPGAASSSGFLRIAPNLHFCVKLPGFKCWQMTPDYYFFNTK